jgi:DNA uptake protein ComE-like DNA-binding protein
MNIFKSHFWYNKSQRNGVFLLIVLIVVLQVFIFVDVFADDKIIDTNNPELLAFQKHIDSLKAIEIESRKPKVYPFNPNYITDYKGEQLGMSLVEIDRLLAFRKTNKFVNSKEEFQNITKISDSLLNKISPYFKFPGWVVKQNESSNLSLQDTKQPFSKSGYKKKEIKISTTNINKATAEDLQSISGIGPAFSNRIIKYRSKLQGFSFDDQLYEVWGLEKEVADRVLVIFKIDEKPIIKKVNINTVEFKQLLKNPYIDYELCKKIFNYRDEVAELQNISQLTNIEGFPLELYDRIVLYLVAK